MNFLATLIISIVGGTLAATRLESSSPITGWLLYAALSGGLFMLIQGVLLAMVVRAESRKRLAVRTISKAKLPTPNLLRKAVDENESWLTKLVLYGESPARYAQKWRAAGKTQAFSVARFAVLRVLSLIFFGTAGAVVAMLFTDNIVFVAVAGLIGVVVGFIAPGNILTGRADERGAEVTRDLADALDVLTIYTGAGVPFDAAIADAGPMLAKVTPSLAMEMQILADDLKFSEDRTTAYDALSRRASSDAMREFVSILKQAEEVGSPLTPPLQRLAGELRKEKLLHAERKAASLSIKLMMPMLLSLFALLIAVMFSPIYQAIAGFKGVF